MCKLFTDKHSILQHDISIHGMCELRWQHDDVDEAWPGVDPTTVYANGGYLIIACKDLYTVSNYVK